MRRALRTAAVCGIGQTRFAKAMGRSELDLASEAVLAACADAGIAPTTIDGVASYHVEQVAEIDLAYALGFQRLRYMGRSTSGGGGAAGVLGLAAMAVESGQAECVVVFRARNRTKTASYGSGQNEGGRPWEKNPGLLTDRRQWHHPFGVAAPAHEMALIARRHMHVFGTTAEQFGQQAVVQRAYAATNPSALMRTPITLDDWANSRPIADPIRLFDCSLEHDGAVALLVTTLERARDLAPVPAVVLAHGHCDGPIHVDLATFFAETALYGERDTGALRFGRELFASAGIVPSDVDAAMIFDHFTMAVPLSLEQYGFCELGGGGPFVASGATGRGGALPVNTHGGSNGEAFVHGVNHLSEAVRQIRGTSANQVSGAEVTFVCGSITDPSGAVLLGADR